MTPRPTHPDDIKPLGGGTKQRFVKTRFGWEVHTTFNCFIIEVVPFAFTLTGIERKAKRLARSLARRDTRPSFERRYAPPPPGPAPAGLGHCERTPR